MKIALACDHGAYDLKETIKAHLDVYKRQGLNLIIPTVKLQRNV